MSFLFFFSLLWSDPEKKRCLKCAIITIWMRACTIFLGKLSFMKRIGEAVSNFYEFQWQHFKSSELPLRIFCFIRHIKRTIPWKFSKIFVPRNPDVTRKNSNSTNLSFNLYSWDYIETFRHHVFQSRLINRKVNVSANIGLCLRG